MFLSIALRKFLSRTGRGLRFCRNANFPVFQKSRRSVGEKSAGTVRSRRMKFCEKGFGDCATNKQKLISVGHAGNQF